MRVPIRRVSPSALAFVLALALVSANAAASHATRLGNPTFETLTAKIAPPYTDEWNLHTAVSGWPPLLDITYKRQDQKDSTGLVYVARTFNTHVNWHDKGAAMANDAGTFLSWAEMSDPHSYLDHSGVFSFTQWSQSFRKDAPDATYHFTITGAKLYTRCLTTNARAEFATTTRGYQGSTLFYTFEQVAGLQMIGSPPSTPGVLYTVGGPMTFTTSNPDGIQRDYQMDFGPRTEYVDLSTVPVGGEFSIVHEEMTLGAIAFDEIVRAYAYFRDPADDSSGVVVETSGLTPTDNPQIPVVSAPMSPLAGRASLSPTRPNPSADAVTLRLELPAAGDVDIGVYDVSGRCVADLGRGRLGAGTHALRWDARDSGGAPMPAGLYFVRVSGPELRLVQRVVRTGQAR